MRPILAILIPLITLGLVSCQSWLHPRTTQEKNILGLEVDAPGQKEMLGMSFGGIGLGSSPSDLKKFSQIKKISPMQDGMTIYQIYNPNENISMMIAWYQDNRLKKTELRYLNAAGVATLTNSGGWDGIANYLTNKFGPPSMVGTNVPIVATQDGLKSTNAVFNGVWVFSRVNRQLNYLAYTNMAFINLNEPKPVNKKGKVIHKKSPKPPSDTPGIST
jgi:hypothetical protein